MTPGAQLAARRRIYQHNCQECGELFPGIKTARYCSGSCQQKAKRKRASKKETTS
jgi:rRNA maturation endonuclease Nob1